jgi:hypothetical protein
VTTVVGDDLDGVDAQSASVRDLPEAVERDVNSHGAKANPNVTATLAKSSDGQGHRGIRLFGSELTGI